MNFTHRFIFQVDQTSIFFTYLLIVDFTTVSRK